MTLILNSEGGRFLSGSCFLANKPVRRPGAPGLYLLTLGDETGRPITHKIIKY